MSCIVEQFGLAMIPSCHARSSGFTWDTTSGTSGSIRQALELSTTTQPRLAASGASSFDVPPPAEKIAMSMPSKASGVASSTVMSRPATDMVVPAERADARRRSSVYGNCFSVRTWIMVRPTAPVAPTTATVSFSGLVSGTVRPASDGLSGTARVYQRAPAELDARPDATSRLRTPCCAAAARRHASHATIRVARGGNVRRTHVPAAIAPESPARAVVDVLAAQDDDHRGPEPCLPRTPGPSPVERKPVTAPDTKKRPRAEARGRCRALGDAAYLARCRCIAALRDRLTRPWRSISVTTTMTSSPTDTTSSTDGTW